MKTQTMVTFELQCRVTADVLRARNAALALAQELEKSGIISKRRARLAFDRLDEAFLHLKEGISEAGPADLT